MPFDSWNSLTFGCGDRFFVYTGQPAELLKRTLGGEQEGYPLASTRSGRRVGRTMAAKGAGGLGLILPGVGLVGGKGPGASALRTPDFDRAARHAGRGQLTRAVF
jgi:hypothetical protein